MADDIGILHQGRLLEEDTYQALAQRSGECIRLTVSNVALAAAVLEKQLGLPQEAYIIEDGQRIRITSLAYEPARINAVLVQAGLGVSALYTERGSLESYFQHITGGEGIA